MSALAPNYDPLDVELVAGEGAYVTASDGTRYLDCLSGYSALNFGHRHPGLIEAAKSQLDKLTLTSRAVGHEHLERFGQAVTDLTGTEMVLPMNTGAEAVETALKTARKWGYEVKGVPENQAEIIVAEGAFHGRTTTIISFSTDPSARTGFGPYTPGFTAVPYGDAQAAADAITDNTVAMLIEPVQGENGVIIPPEHYLRRLREVADETNTLLILDEIQSGLGRTGATLTQELSGVKADLTTLGKALGGGIVPVSAVVGRKDVLSVMTAGVHGSTFGGNPLACAVAIAVTELLATGEFQERARQLSPVLAESAKELVADGYLSDARVIGLWMGIDVTGASGREISKRLAAQGILAKETHGNTIRFAPPLCVQREDLDVLTGALNTALRES